MAKIRSIHPEACENDKLLALSDGAERTLWRLLCHSDDEGRGVDNSKLIASKCYPIDDSKDAEVVDAHLWELVEVGMLVRYEVDGKRYYEVHDFTDWQKPRHKTPTKLPAPSDGEHLPPPDPSDVPETDDGHMSDNRPTPAAEHHHGGGEGVGGGGGEGKPDGDADAPRWPRITNDGTFTDQVIAWAWANGHARHLETPEDRTRWCLDLAEDQLGGTNRFTGAACELVVEWVEDMCGERLSRAARKHLVRLMNTEGPKLTFAAMAEAVKGGAGLSAEYADDDQALVKYARRCIANWRAADRKAG